MSQVFIRVYLDEDVDVLVAKLLNARGFTAITTLQANQLGKSDSEQMEYAISQKAVILTHNRADFEELAKTYFEQDRSHYGIIIAFRNSYSELLIRLLKILNNTTADEPDARVTPPAPGADIDITRNQRS